MKQLNLIGGIGRLPRLGFITQLGNIQYISNNIIKYLLTLSKTGNGAIEPDVGEYKYKKGTPVTITASETDEDCYFNRYIEAGQPDRTDLEINVTMNGNRAIQAEFLEWNKIMEVYESKPVYDSGNNNWKYEGGLHDSIVKKSQCLSLDGIGVGLYSNAKLTGGKAIDFTWYLTQDDFATSQTYLDCGATLVAYKGIYFYRNLNDSFYVFTSDGTTRVFATGSGTQANFTTGVNVLRLQWNGLTGGTLTVTLNGYTIINSTTTQGWTGDNSTICYFMKQFNTSWFNGKLYRIVSNCDVWKFDVTFNEQTCNYFYDSSRNNNELLLTNNTSYNIWQNTSDVCEPYSLTRGFFSLKNSISAYSTIRPYDISTSFDITAYTNRWAGATEYNVYEDGSGDYPTIRAALVALVGTYSSRIIINVHAGTYNDQDLPPKDYIWLRAIGTVIIYSDGNSTAISPVDYSFPTYANTAYNLIPQAYKHCFYINKNMIVTGIDIRGTNIKYNVHADNSGTYKAVFDSCTFDHIESAGTYLNNFGIGLYANQALIISNSTLKATGSLTIANDSRIFIHNTANQTLPCNLYLHNVTAETGNLLYVQQESNTNDVKDCIIVDNCSAPAGEGVYFYSINSGYNYTLNLGVINSILTYSHSNRANYADYISEYYINNPQIDLINEYNIPVDSVLNQIIAAGDYNFAGLINLVQTVYLRISKTLKIINKIIARIKQ